MSLIQKADVASPNTEVSDQDTGPLIVSMCPRGEILFLKDPNWGSFSESIDTASFYSATRE